MWKVPLIFYWLTSNFFYHLCDNFDCKIEKRKEKETIFKRNNWMISYRWAVITMKNNTHDEKKSPVQLPHSNLDGCCSVLFVSYREHTELLVDHCNVFVSVFAHCSLFLFVSIKNIQQFNLNFTLRARGLVSLGLSYSYSNYWAH